LRVERETDNTGTEESPDAGVDPSADPGEPVMQAIGESDPGPPDMQAIAGSGAGHKTESGFVFDEGDDESS
jgi:hypothetical protein